MGETDCKGGEEKGNSGVMDAEKGKYMLIRSCIKMDHSLNISEETTFDMFKNSLLYDATKSDQVDNRFFWITDVCEVEGMSEKFKIGFWFINNRINEVRLYCIDEQIQNEDERNHIHKIVLNGLTENHNLKCKRMKYVFNERENYSSIFINF